MYSILLSKLLNISVGVLGIIYIVNDWIYRFIVNLFVFKGYTVNSAQEITDKTHTVFSFIICLTVLIVVIGMFALLENLIHFYSSYFFIKLILEIMCMLMPFMYTQKSWFIVYELVFCVVFGIYLYCVKKMEQSVH